MQRKRGQNVIHPSIDALLARIAAVDAGTSQEDLVALRTACHDKVRSYPLDTFLRSQAGVPTARERYETVARFAIVRHS